NAEMEETLTTEPRDLARGSGAGYERERGLNVHPENCRWSDRPGLRRCAPLPWRRAGTALWRPPRRACRRTLRWSGRTLARRQLRIAARLLRAAGLAVLPLGF